MFLAGCGDGLGNRQEVRGTVKLKGVLLDEGVIIFTPIGNTEGESPGANAATKSGGLIKNGQYLVPRSAGLMPGKYRVVLSSGDGKTQANDGPPGPSGNIISVDRIPPEYNEESKQEIVVTEKGPNEFNYDIP